MIRQQDVKQCFDFQVIQLQAVSEMTVRAASAMPQELLVIKLFCRLQGLTFNMIP